MYYANSSGALGNQGKGKSEMKILLDCDGVLADFIGGALQEINRIMWPHGRAFGRAAVTKRDMVAALGIEEHRYEIEAIFRRPGFAYELPAIDGAVRGVASLKALGTIRIATAPMPDAACWYAERINWLMSRFNIHPGNVSFLPASKKHELSADIFVDDDPDTVRRWGEAYPDGLSVLFAQPHNAAERAGLVWVKDWMNLTTLINEYQKEAV